MEEDSILNTIKSMLGIEEHDDGFDNDIIVFTNTVLSTLYQIGVSGNSYITDNNDTWNDIFADSLDLLDFIKTYIYMKVKVMFDPPSSSFVLTSLNEQIDELEWRIYIQAEEVPNNDDDSESHDRS